MSDPQSSIRTRVPAVLLQVLAVVQIGILAAALARLIDTAWGTTGILGTLYGIGIGAAVALVFLTLPARHRLLFAIASLITVGTALGGALDWASLGGQGMLFDQDHAGRIWLLIVGDLMFAGWLLIARRETREAHVGWFGSMFVFIGARAALEAVYFVPLLLPPPVINGPQVGGFSSGGVMSAVAIGFLVVAGYLGVPLWEFALGRRLRRPDASVPQSQGWLG